MILGASCMFRLGAGCAEIKAKIQIEAGIRRYSPAMSATPGIPLRVRRADGKVFKNVNYRWTTEYGRFLRWDKKVETMGAALRSGPDKLYWSVDFKQKRPVTHFDIRGRVEKAGTGKVVAEAKIKMERDQNGYFLVGSP